MALGFEKALGVPPLAIISAGFKNDQHYINYMNNIRKLDIPVINMDVQYTKFLDEISFKCSTTPSPVNVYAAGAFSKHTTFALVLNPS